MYLNHKTLHISGGSFPSDLRFMILAYFQLWERAKGQNVYLSGFPVWDLEPCGGSAILVHNSEIHCILPTP